MRILETNCLELQKIDINNSDLVEFTEIFLSELDKHTHKRQKFIQAIKSTFKTKSNYENITTSK